MSLFAAEDLPETPAVPAPPPAYRVLARKYRPQNFQDLIGQDALVRTLTNALQTGRLAQAYMLTGVRGVGKTTTARIIARALNCIGPDGTGGPTPNPCGVCTHCTQIAADRHVDVLEMDAASNTGIDDVRQIIEGVRYAPTSARQKVYIIDEVHMLSKNAFNALLKTLEEPPPHVTFVFATTEIRKVPVTVLSRCQRFDLRRVEEDVLAAHFAKVTAAEAGAIDAGALALISRAADGSVRDGLSLLDQALAQGEGNVRAEEVRAMLGLADRGRVITLFEHLLTGEMREALALCAELDAAGGDPLLLAQDLAELTHLLTRARALHSPSASLPELERGLIERQAQVPLTALARIWQMLLKALQEIQHAPDPRRALEMALIRLCLVSDMPTPGELVKQLNGMTASAAGPSKTPTAPPTGSGGGARMMAGNAAAAFSAAPAAQAAPHASPQSFRDVVALFDQRREAMLYAQLYMNAYLVRLDIKADGAHLALRLGPGAPADLPGRVGEKLTQWTGRRWVVSLSKEEGAHSLADQERRARDAARARAEDSAPVHAVLAAFPGATIRAVRPRKTAPTPALTGAAGEGTLPPADEDSL